ncbi:MAG: GerW family sporulation protein [Clostridiales bacterium]|nr:GerW family sporulation protein [Clostridiales bacterium]
MAEHPIEALVQKSMQAIKDMVDVDTIIGKAVVTDDGSTIIPISRVAFGFGVGGSDFFTNKTREDQKNPFGGGCGTGVTIVPVAFMVVGKGQIKLIPINPGSNIYDKLLEMIPDAIDKITESVGKLKTKKACPSTCCDVDDDSLDFSNDEYVNNITYDESEDK